MSDIGEREKDLERTDPEEYCAKYGHRWRPYLGGEPLTPRKVCGTCKADVAVDPNACP